MNIDSIIALDMHRQCLWDIRTFYHHFSSPEFRRLPINLGEKIVVFYNVTHKSQDKHLLITHIATHLLITPYCDGHEGNIVFKMNHDDYCYTVTCPLFERVSDLHFGILNEREELGFRRPSYSVSYYKGRGTLFSEAFCHKVVEQGLALENWPHSAYY